MPRNALHPNLQNFRVLLPVATHRMVATCEDVDCDHYLNGWMTVVEVDSRQDIYIRKHSGRKWTVTKVGTQLEYRFEAGQKCFTEHTRLNGREPFYLHETRDGRRMHRAQDFMEHAKQEIQKHGPQG